MKSLLRTATVALALVVALVALFTLQEVRARMEQQTPVHRVRRVVAFSLMNEGGNSA